MAHEQADQVGGFESQQVAETAPHRAGLTDLDPFGIDGVRYDVNPLARNVVELLEMPPDQVADRDDPGLAIGCILSALDRPVDRISGVEHLAQDIQAAQERAREAAGIGFQAAGVHASLGNDHVMCVSIDESDGAVIFSLIECGRGVESEVPDLLPPAVARRGHRDATDLRR